MDPLNDLSELVKGITSRVSRNTDDIGDLNKVVNELGQDRALFHYKQEQARRVSDKLEQLVDRITEKGEDSLKETIDIIDKREARLAESIVAHKEIILREVALQHQTMKQSIDTLTQKMADIVSSQAEDRKSFLAIQKWAFMLMGGVGVLAAFGDKILALIFHAG
jgi:chromosome segregation ATPase